MKKFVKHGITIIGIAVLILLVGGSVACSSSIAGAIASDLFGNKPSASDAYDRGKEYSSKGNYKQAIIEFTEWIELNPDSSVGYYNRGLAYEKINDFEKAITDYNKAIELDPKSANAYNNRAWIYAYHLKKDFNRAISDANQAISINPNNSIYFGTRGWGYLGNNDYGKAIADFEKSLQIDKNNNLSIEGLRLAQSAPQLAKDEDFEVKQNTDNTITITNYKGNIKNIIIPDKLYGLKVTIIAGEAFHDKGLISVVIPDTVITIEDGKTNRRLDVGVNYYKGAFSNNKELIKVTLGKGIKTIGGAAFDGTNLSEIIIPDSVTEIGNSSFSMAGLKNVTFGKGLQTIGNEAFRNNQITEINLPSSLKEIGAGAFYRNSIQKITFGTGLQNISTGAFKYNQITELNNLPSSLKTIYGGAFANNQIQSLTIPSSVTTISSDMMGGHPEYNNRNYNEGAFANNPITTLVIPASLANRDIKGVFSRFEYTQIASITTTFTRITIPAGMREDTIRGLFEESFVNFWLNQNRAGGTYVKRGPIWAKE